MVPNAVPIVYEFDANLNYIRNYTLSSSVNCETDDQEYQSLDFNTEATSPSSDENSEISASEISTHRDMHHCEDRIPLQQILINELKKDEGMLIDS